MHKVLVTQSHTYICIKRVLSTSNCIYSLCLEQSDLVSCKHSTIVFVGFFVKVDVSTSQLPNLTYTSPQLKWAAWIGVYCSLVYLVNSRAADDKKQMLSLFM